MSENLDATDEDRKFADLILADFNEFEEGITDAEKLAEWIRNVRRAAETGIGLGPRLSRDWEEQFGSRE